MTIHDPTADLNTRTCAPVDVRKLDTINGSRLAWADIAKGWSIILVVLMHSTLGVGDDLGMSGWTHAVVAYAKPFRMPDFFLVAGLFAGMAMERSWRDFIDRRILHFVYFYVLWSGLTIVIKGVGGSTAVSDIGDLLVQSLYEPFSALWFIYVLPIMFLIVRLARGISPVLVLLAAIELHVLAAMQSDGSVYALSSNLTGFFALDSLALFLVFFLIGHYGRSTVFRLAAWAQQEPTFAVAGLAIWALVNGACVATGLAELSFLVLPLGMAGALAVVVASALMALIPLFSVIAAIGRQSLIIYVAFTIPMAAARMLLIHLGFVSDTGWASLATATVALTAPLVLFAVVRNTPLSFLFKRPAFARLKR